MVTFYLVQHGEKIRSGGDPSLTARGLAQARHTAAQLRGEGIAHLFASPQRRAAETANALAGALNLPACHDDRLRERMNWGDGPAPQPLAAFLDDWARATADRDFQPPAGDSSRAAGARLLALLEEITAADLGARVALVTHGGVTVDALRNLFPDEALARANPAAFEAGPAGCAITRLVSQGGCYTLEGFASVTHLPPALRTSHRA